MPRKKTKAPFRFLWITDPWDTLDHARDTSLRLAREANFLGHESYWCDLRTIRWEKGAVVLPARRILNSPTGQVPALGVLQNARVEDFQSIQYRTDPPVDLCYLQPLQLLLLAAERKKIPLVNPPEMLMMANEKLEASFLGELMPPSTVSSQREPLAAFGRTEGRVVLKPLHQAQSQGVELLDWRTDAGREHAEATIRKATDEFTRPVILQRYLEGIKNGETRLWFLDGKLLAHIRKLPLTGDFRVNIDQGSRLATQPLTPVERKIASVIGRHLARRKVRLAAVDLIDGYVTDLNFTSPGLIVQMEQLLGENLAKPIIQALVRKS